MKIYTWKELLENEIAVLCPEDWMREQMYEYAINVVGDEVWSYYQDKLHHFGENTAFYIEPSSHANVRNGVEVMYGDYHEINDYFDCELVIPYEQCECYWMYNNNDVDLDSFENILLEV